MSIQGVTLPGDRAALIKAATRAAKLCGPLALTTLCLWLLWPHFAGLSASDVLDRLGHIPVGAWALGFAASALSYWAIGSYDAIIHRVLRTGVAPARARWAGAAAIAVSQTTGFGAFVAGALRWRLFSHLGLGRIAVLSASVTVGFLAAWGVFSAFLLIALPHDITVHRGLLAALLFSVLGGLMAVALSPGLQGKLHRTLPQRMPSLAAMAALLGAAAADIVFACAAFAAFLPDMTLAAFLALLPAYALALGAGLIGNTPAGIGPFELTLILLLPAVSPSDLAAAYLGYRVVYFLVPALLGLLYLAFAPRGAMRVQTLPPYRPSTWAESGLVRQGNLDWAPGPDALPLGRTANVVFSLGPLPPGGEDRSLKQLRGHAAHELRHSLAYKLPARSAALARKAGWHLHKVAEEAVLNPQSFTHRGPKARGLRRKLRQARGADIQIYPRWNLPPTQEMQLVSDLWITGQGRERGITTGRFEPGYVADQFTLLAYQCRRLVAFVTFHTGPREWTLDLIRTVQGCPTGTVHALVDRALSKAKAAGLTRLSLAAVPTTPQGRGLASRLYATLQADIGAAGLRQFKGSFAPRWEPLYAAAPTRLALALGGWELSRLARTPPPLPKIDVKGAHDRHEEYEFALN